MENQVPAGKRRRRILLLACGGFVLGAGLLNWWLTSPTPLTPPEQGLVGTWATPSKDLRFSTTVWTFYPDRTGTRTDPFKDSSAPPLRYSFTWRVEDDTLRVRRVNPFSWDRFFGVGRGRGRPQTFQLVSVTGEAITLGTPNGPIMLTPTGSYGSAGADAGRQ